MVWFNYYSLKKRKEIWHPEKKKKNRTAVSYNYSLSVVNESPSTILIRTIYIQKLSPEERHNINNVYTY